MRELTSSELHLVAGGLYSCDFDDAYNAYAGIVNPGSVGIELISIYEVVVMSTSHVIVRVANALKN